MLYIVYSVTLILFNGKIRMDFDEKEYPTFVIGSFFSFSCIGVGYHTLGNGSSVEK
jgi:hypothetical protein